MRDSPLRAYYPSLHVCVCALDERVALLGDNLVFFEKILGPRTRVHAPRTRAQGANPGPNTGPKK